MKILLILLFLSGIAKYGFSQNNDQVDLVSLAGRLMKDGDYTKAESVLAQVPEDRLSTPQYKTIRGLLHLYQEQFSDALSQFNQLIADGSDDRYLWIYKGQSLYGLQQYKKSIDAFDHVNSLAQSIPSVFLIKAQAFWQLNQKDQAWQILRSAQNNFPTDFRFPKAQIRWLLELNLFQEVYSYGLRLFESQAFTLDDYLSIASSLRLKKEYDLAIKLLEIIHLVNQDSVPIKIQLALTYIKQGKFFAAAHFFEKASYLNQKYVFEAAELYRRAGKYQLAMAFNQKVLDQKKKFKQKLALFISQGNYEAAAITETDLKRLGLLAEEDIRYAIAYALFRVGNFQRVDHHLSQIRDPELIKKASVLRKEIAECRETRSCA